MPVVTFDPFGVISSTVPTWVGNPGWPQPTSETVKYHIRFGIQRGNTRPGLSDEQVALSISLKRQSYCFLLGAVGGDSYHLLPT